VAVVALLVQNHESLSTEVSFKADFLIFQRQSPQINLYLIIAIVFIFGVIVSGLYGIVERFRLKKQIKLLEHASVEKNKELNSLRNLPITSDDVAAGPPNNVMEAN
jgi:hypothetical protein